MATILIGVGIALFLYFAPGIGDKGFNIQLFGFDIKIARTLMIGIILGFFLLSIIVVWFSLLIKYWFNKKIKLKPKQIDSLYLPLF